MSIAEIRHLVSGGRPSSASTRLGRCTPANFTGGRDAVPPTLPVCWIPASHSAAAVPSPGARICWSRVQVSTFLYALPDSTCVVTDASRLRVQNVGEYRSRHVSPESQFWSKGTSGQYLALLLVNLLSAQSKLDVGMHRSLASKTTRAGAEEEKIASERCP
ncbi:hypothetical protein [Nonomuraea salmonea]|uniref:hypothetical protein n=1 Tax=Nonomuraea salmonea TaxID=46181 RepID=UPI0031E97226